MESEQLTTLKNTRARRLGALTRIRRRAFVLIDTKGRKTHLTEILKELDVALDAISEVNDQYVEALQDEIAREQARKYFAEVEAQHADAIQRIRQHLLERVDEAPSISSAKSQSVQPAGSTHSERQSRDAEIQARLKELRLSQLDQQHANERKEQELQQQRKKQDAEDELEAARLEASLRKAAEDSLQWERKDDFIDEDQETSKRKSGATRVIGQNMTAEQPRCTLFEKSIPRVTLPTFSGNVAEWPRWYGLFKALVHNQPSLSETEKMVHLQSAVTGLAQKTISGMILNPDLYPKALEALKDRFGRTDDVIHSNLCNIFDRPNPSYTDVRSLEEFQAAVNCTVVVLESYLADADLNSHENLRRTVEKLPIEMRREWAKYAYHQSEKPNLIAFNTWLAEQVRIALTCVAEPTTRDRRQSAVRRAAMMTSADASCPCCGEAAAHSLEHCGMFREKTPDARVKQVMDAGLCLYCLQPGHRIRNCRVARPCGKEGCAMRHHELLHGSQRISRGAVMVPNQNGSDEASASRTVAVAAVPPLNDVTLLQIVQVKVHGSDGKSRNTYALLDPGAQTSLCCQELLTDLNISGEEQNLCLQNVEGSGAPRTSMRVTLEVSACSSEGQTERICVQEAFSVPRINVNTPQIDAKKARDWHHLSGIELPNYQDAKVELLLGANVIEAVLQKEVRVGRSGQPIAVRTAFGWTLTGSVKGFIPERARQVMFISKLATDEDLSMKLQEWWTTESFGTTFEGAEARSPEDCRAVEIMENTTRTVEGRYETGLLWKSEDVTLPDNKPLAVSRLRSLEKSLSRLPEKATAYKKVINGYIDSGFACKLSIEDEFNPRTWFLPHHGVINIHKPGKLRVVFDAAAKYGGTSLNDQLLTGPDLLRGLPGVLLRFREDCVAMTADIEQMYHQVRIIQPDQAALRFLWRNLDPTKEPAAYQMMVAIFGAKSSPASANFVLRRTADDYSSDTPVGQRAKVAVHQNFYMDDFVRSDRTVQEAKALQKEVTQLLIKGGFRLTKWKSNSPEVLSEIAASECAQEDTAVAVENVLGCAWNTLSDTIGVRPIDCIVPATKRGVVQGVARLFDPLGLAAPFVLKAKILVQRLWADGYGWDQELTGDLLHAWTQWIDDLPLLELLTIPRCFRQTSDSDDCRQELHVFCDASQDAFGTVAYIKSVMSDGSSSSTLAVSKTRVAPLRQLSIVRLELQAAVLATRLANVLRKELSNSLERIQFWTDSTVVLQYVRNDSRRFNTFVANRVAEIRESSDPSQWRHVPTDLNPADICSRGASASVLASEVSWCSGPEYLLKPEEDWPKQVPQTTVMKGDPEVKTALMMTLEPRAVKSVLPVPARFSSWTRYRRVVAWMLRFVKNFTAKHRPSRAEWRCEGPLSVEEIKQAETMILLDCQAKSLSKETMQIKTSASVKNAGRLQQLSPFLDRDGIMRVGGRIDRAPAPYSVRHPVILPSDDDVTRLIVTYVHQQVQHSGLERTLTEVRAEYWLTKARSTVRSILFKCPVCRRRRACPRPPRMAELPDARFDASRAFSTVGVDYFGPMLVKKFRKTEKRYGVLFTCLTMRAVHLEVASSLDADSFIMAFRRFMARRGRPQHVYSDNGTNLVGGERELRESLAEWDQARLTDQLSQEHIKWNFLPPTASHMGGAWERMVASVKRALKIVLGTQCVTDEVLLTALAEVESMINGRPLTYISSDATDMEPLTPNHLLLGCATANLSPGSFQEREISSRRRWRQSQVLADHFWRRWRREYVPTLMQRQKWSSDVRNVQVGDVVLMVEADAPRGFWPLARVVRVFPGSDGRVRSVELKVTGGGTYQRPVTKVCLLEETE